MTLVLTDPGVLTVTWTPDAAAPDAPVALELQAREPDGTWRRIAREEIAEPGERFTWSVSGVEVWSAAPRPGEVAFPAGTYRVTASRGAEPDATAVAISGPLEVPQGPPS